MNHCCCWFATLCFIFTGDTLDVFLSWSNFAINSKQRLQLSHRWARETERNCFLKPNVLRTFFCKWSNHFRRISTFGMSSSSHSWTLVSLTWSTDESEGERERGNLIADKYFGKDFDVCLSFPHLEFLLAVWLLYCNNSYFVNSSIWLSIKVLPLINRWS